MQLPITQDNVFDWFTAPHVENPLAGDPWWQLQSLGLLVATQLLRLVPPGPSQQQALVELRRAIDTALLTLPAPSDDEVRRRLAQTLAPFSPAPFEVVEAMLDLADLRPDDYLVDLGSGDGRIPLAASLRGARAMGVEIDALLVGQAVERIAENPGYAGASFVHDDIHNVDLSAATVVTCYLLSSSMHALEARFRACRPGTRIISHAFDMPGWEPSRIGTDSGWANFPVGRVMRDDKTFLFPSPPSSKILTLPSDTERRDLRTLAPYVPSDPTVVEAMLDIADLKAGDLLMDLGCGDGRIVFGAARRGIRAIGVDVDPVFVVENMKLASADPALASATFILSDILTVDLSAASVITCYLLPDAMRLLQPKFETSLKPGTRIVSHAFRLNGWEPVKMVWPEHRLGTVCLWVV